METTENHKQTANNSQAVIRFADLRRWMYLHNITFAAIGRVLGVTAGAANVSLSRDRMPVRHHRAITAKWPDLPVELLPEPRDVPIGPRPKSLQLEEEEV